MPPPKPTRFCQWLLRVCRECKAKLDRYDESPTCIHCGADRHCGMPVVKGFSACQEHGGPNPHRGRFGMQQDLNKFKVIKLAQTYRTMVKDSRLLTLRASIEVVRGRISQLAERIDFNEAPERLSKLGKLWEEYQEAVDKDARSDMIVLQRQISAQFAAAREDYLAWTQMLEAIDLDRKLVDSEVKIVKELHAILTAEDAYELVAKLLSVVLRVFPEDKRKLRQVQYEFVRLIGDRPIDIVEPEADEDTLEDEGENPAQESEPLYEKID